jgi:oxaloacetate decarboxylase alpha subunit
MNFKELKELIEIASTTANIEELEVEKAGVRLRVRKVGGSANPTQSLDFPPGPDAAASAVNQPSAETPTAAEAAGVFFVASPMVGTFYRASSPDSEPFVKVGDFVEKGSVVCIVEAMKLMNEIESEVAGEIVSIPVENGQPVEYGERLFAIRPR